ncbi:hypothetical protein EC973_005230 [Apophysomyces ossiformis]|uniref:Uncharacterized protein n=1 Tax=Apophysomyces ossiformis TaxID=679940 RepID=A0A8H7ETN6_9FUNG|nr:hypothetical protein EC973_005230 [Apophysomyces ossiformis]
MVVEKIFGECNDIPEHKVVTYKLQPSQHIQMIRNVIIQRKRKQHQCSMEREEEPRSKTRHIEEPEVCNGLPSPPVEKAELLEEKVEQPTPWTIQGMTELEIHKKLQELRDEKHRLFQLIKRLVQEEAENRQKPTMTEKPEEKEQEAKTQQPPIQETPARWKNKRPSRWAPREPPKFYRQAAPLFYPYNNPRHSPLPFRYNDPRFQPTPNTFQPNPAVSISKLQYYS